MDKCKYASSVKCDKCNVVYYTKCPKFVKAHFCYLNREILPFVYKRQNVFSYVVWSKDENRIKSAAASKALEVNSQVKKLSASQVISAVLSNIEFDNKIFYIEYKQKLQGDVEKVKSCLVSFIENSSMAGAYVFIYASASSGCTFDYDKL